MSFRNNKFQPYQQHWPNKPSSLSYVSIITISIYLCWTESPDNGLAINKTTKFPQSLLNQFVHYTNPHILMPTLFSRIVSTRSLFLSQTHTHAISVHFYKIYIYKNKIPYVRPWPETSKLHYTLNWLFSYQIIRPGF